MTQTMYAHVNKRIKKTPPKTKTTTTITKERNNHVMEQMIITRKEMRTVKIFC
jgi:hypothetical protein